MSGEPLPFVLKPRVARLFDQRHPAGMVVWLRPLLPVAVLPVEVTKTCSQIGWAREFYDLYHQHGSLNEATYAVFCTARQEQGARSIPLWQEVKAILDCWAERRNLGDSSGWADADRPEDYRD